MYFSQNKQILVNIGKNHILAMPSGNKMDYMKVLVSIILILTFLLLFGYGNINKLMQDRILVTQNEIEPKTIKPPGTNYNFRVIAIFSTL